LASPRSRTAAVSRLPGRTMSLPATLNRIQQIQAQLALAAGGAVVPTATTAAPSAPASAPAGAGTTFDAVLADATARSAPGAALPSGAATRLTSGQQQFAERLAAQTGLDPGVIGAWLLAEESGSAATAREAAGNNDWLNIGYTDSGTYGAGDPIWADPISAADATAGWLKGEDTVPGYGPASAGVRSIL